MDDGAHVEDVLAHLAPKDPRARAFAWFLALGTLRRRGHVDAALRPVLSRPIATLDPEIRATLRVATFEKLYGRNDDHVVVHQAVEVAKALGAGRARGLVNAVMRRVEAPRDLAAFEALDHPAWIVARWTGRYGEEATRAWCEANAEPPPLTAVVRGDAAALFARWAEDGITVEPVTVDGRSLDGVVHVIGHTGAVPDLPGFDEGAFWIQDAAAVAVADLVQAGPGVRVLDACAAPGGKTARLVAAGASVTAVDVVGARLARMREGLARLEVDATLRHHDWTEGPMPDAGAPFDAVLVDAPCTGLGTVRRHPEIRWRRQLLDVLQAPETQLAILEGAAHHVRSGGVLVYAVCSPEPEEGEGVVQRFLDDHPEFTLELTLDTAPPQDGEDAHQAFRLVRA